MREIKTNYIYKHFKGNLYLVENIAKNSETDEKMVIYRALYGNCELFVRPYSSFESLVDKKKYPNTTQIYKFEEITIPSMKKI